MAYITIMNGWQLDNVGYEFSGTTTPITRVITITIWGLSGRRAKAVTGALANQYGIDANRLRAAGVGFLAPVASNDTSAGREKNRRVELVKQ